jgi:YggT family protein
MGAIRWLIDNVLWAFIVLLFAQVILSWLIAFNIVNTRHPFVSSVGRFLYKITEPVLRPIRRVVPPIGGIDISPLLLLLLVGFIHRLLMDNLPY